MIINDLKSKIMAGEAVTKDEIYELYNSSLDQLCEAADELREEFCGRAFDICTIINGKSGKCTEDCKFCAQSSKHETMIKNYPLLTKSELVKGAQESEAQGILRYSIVTSGKRLTESEVDKMCEAIEEIRVKTGISVCISFGLLDEKQYRKLKQAGVTRVHNNLETSRENFPNICTTHTYDEKIQAIKAAQSAGLTVCSGGIMGLGETINDRIEMAFELANLGIKSVPINILNPIKGTPFEALLESENSAENCAENGAQSVEKSGAIARITDSQIRRIVAIYRHILPAATIRLAGGRGQLQDKGAGCLKSGANAVITGDMLTTAGITVAADMELLRELGYEKKLCNES